jgi:hypothetical protein
MIDEPWRVEDIAPSQELDRRVRRRMQAVTRARAGVTRASRTQQAAARMRKAAPFLPFERAVYVLLVAVYAIYAGARTVQVLQERGARFSQRVEVGSSAPTS